MDVSTLIPSNMTNADVARLLEHIRTLRRSVWLESGVRERTYRIVMAWLDDLGITQKRPGRHRLLLVPLDEAKRRILQRPFVPPAQKRRRPSVDPRHKDNRVWELVQPGPGSLFTRGASFTALELRIEVRSAQAGNESAFANGSRFKHAKTGETAFWYGGKLWEEGEDPRPVYHR